MLQLTVSDGELCTTTDVSVSVTGLPPRISLVTILRGFLFCVDADTTAHVLGFHQPLHNSNPGTEHHNQPCHRGLSYPCHSVGDSWYSSTCASLSRLLINLLALFNVEGIVTIANITDSNGTGKLLNKLSFFLMLYLYFLTSTTVIQQGYVGPGWVPVSGATAATYFTPLGTPSIDGQILRVTASNFLGAVSSSNITLVYATAPGGIRV